MVLLSGHAATWELGRGGFQELRQADMAAPVTKAAFTATSVATLARDLGEAMRVATSGRPGPVHLSLPSDLLDARIAAADVVWPDQTRRKAEKGMDRLSTDIYCSEPGGRQHNSLIGNDLTQTAQQRRFAGPCATGDEKITFSRCGKGCRQLVLFGDLNPIWPRKLAGLAKPRHRICLPTQATACASFRRSIFLRMLGSSQRLRKRMDLGVTSTSSSSAM